MAYLKNPLDHAVRVYDENGSLRRVRPGQVVEADGDFEKNLKAVGAESASQSDYETYEDDRRSAGPSEDVTRSAINSETINEARRAARAATVANLNEVHGDDDAPLGPPSGTVTTKQAVVREGGPAEKRAFGDHERLPEEADNESLSEIERKQAANKAPVEQAVEETTKRVEEANSGRKKRRSRRSQPAESQSQSGSQE